MWHAEWQYHFVWGGSRSPYMFVCYRVSTPMVSTSSGKEDEETPSTSLQRER